MTGERLLGVFRRRKEPQITMPCKVSASMFESERTLIYQDADGNEVVGWADSTEVTTEINPIPGEQVEGRVVVHFVKEEGDRVLVDVPQQVLAGHRRMYVPRDVLRTEE
jgi:hypothetical protein